MILQPLSNSQWSLSRRTRILIQYQSNQYEPFLKELGIRPQDAAKHNLGQTKSGINLQVHTVKTYNPSYAFAGHSDCELLIVIGVPSKDIEKFVDKSRVKYWIVVPWLLTENEDFLAVHEAVNLETNEPLNAIADVDERIKGAVRWLKATSYPNEGYHHPNDEDRLKQMSNALAHYKVPVDFNQVHHYCINHGLCDDAAIKTAEYFVKAQSRKFSTRDAVNYAFMKQMMEKQE